MEDYTGFEQGPIRPPSEAASLLLRVTRNCPWNRCRFCPTFKGSRFSRRPLNHVLADIDAVHQALEEIEATGGATAALRRDGDREGHDPQAWQAAIHWLRHGARQVFFQDADSLIIGAGDILPILRHLKDRFPRVQRITTYARARTIARMSAAALAELRQAGLTRIHIGLESGWDAVLKRVEKGSSRAQQIEAGRKVKEAGIELSEYYMPGLGGRDLWEEHATATATAFNAINPDFIRLRSLALPPQAPLYQDHLAGLFDKGDDLLVARELELFLTNLSGCTGRLVSDHILNLLPEVEGTLPADREVMLAAVRRFLDLDPAEQLLYQAGRRLGVFSGLADLNVTYRRAQVEDFCRRQAITPANLEQLVDDLMRRYIF